MVDEENRDIPIKTHLKGKLTTATVYASNQGQLFLFLGRGKLPWVGRS